MEQKGTCIYLFQDKTTCELIIFFVNSRAWRSQLTFGFERKEPRGAMLRPRLHRPLKTKIIMQTKNLQTLRSLRTQEKAIKAQIDAIKNKFGIKYHYLEKLIENPTDQSWRILNAQCAKSE